MLSPCNRVGSQRSERLHGFFLEYHRYSFDFESIQGLAMGPYVCKRRTLRRQVPSGEASAAFGNVELLLLDFYHARRMPCPDGQLTHYDTPDALTREHCATRIRPRYENHSEYGRQPPTHEAGGHLSS